MSSIQKLSVSLNRRNAPLRLETLQRSGFCLDVLPSPASGCKAPAPRNLVRAAVNARSESVSQSREQLPTCLCVLGADQDQDFMLRIIAVQSAKADGRGFEFNLKTMTRPVCSFVVGGCREAPGGQSAGCRRQRVTPQRLLSLAAQPTCSFPVPLPSLRAPTKHRLGRSLSTSLHLCVLGRGEQRARLPRGPHVLLGPL